MRAIKYIYNFIQIEKYKLHCNLNDIINDICHLKVGGLNKHFLRTHVNPFTTTPKIILLSVYSNSICQ